MTILIRLDISKEIGTGHFRRMFNLSQSMSNYTFTFAIKTDNKLNSIFNNLDIIFLENEKDFIDILQKLKFDLLIIDLLHYQKNYIKNLKCDIKFPVVTFHEYNDYTEFSDLVINYNFIEETNHSDTLLFGPKYIIFSDDITNYHNQDKQDYIFVSFGGSDPSSLTELFVQEVVAKLPQYEFKIHIGNFNQSEGKQFVNLEYLNKPLDLFKYMASAKIAITAAGNMMYELIYFQVPCIVISHNEHQAQFAKNAEKNGYIEYLGMPAEFNASKLVEKILTMNNDKYQYGVIDAKGTNRIIKAIEGLLQ